jgi:outer membrane protein assembly factor BamB
VKQSRQREFAARLGGHAKATGMPPLRAWTLIWGTLWLRLMSGAVWADHWPTWRGPTGQGVCFEANLPLHWNSSENVRWKVRLPAGGNSTPVIWGERVFLTVAQDEGRQRSLLCFSKNSGELMWSRTVAFDGEEPTHPDNPYCSSSPVTDGSRVIVWYGSAGLHCYDLNGQLLWSQDLGTFRHIWGNASSPLLSGDLCFLNAGPGPRSFVLAVNKHTGQTVWEFPVPGGLEGGDAQSWIGSWSTPLLLPLAGREQLVVALPEQLVSLDPTTGRLLWKAGGLGRLIYASPVGTSELVVAMSGYMGPAVAVGVEASAKDHLVARLRWKVERNPQQIGSGVVHERHLYRVTELGIAQCIELATGRVVWQERLGGRCWSSCVLTADDRVYVVDQAGETFVFQADPDRCDVLARNPLRELTRASLAVSDGLLFIRTYEHLWCIGRAPAAPLSRDPEIPNGRR